MKWLKLFFKPPFSDVIELTKDYMRVKRELDNLFYHVFQASKGIDYHYLIDKSKMYHNIEYVQNEFDRIMKENKELKEIHKNDGLSQYKYGIDYYALPPDTIVWVNKDAEKDYL